MDKRRAKRIAYQIVVHLIEAEVDSPSEHSGDVIDGLGFDQDGDDGVKVATALDEIAEHLRRFAEPEN